MHRAKGGKLVHASVIPVCDNDFPIDILGQVWYLILSIPGLWPLRTLKAEYENSDNRSVVRRKSGSKTLSWTCRTIAEFHI